MLSNSVHSKTKPNEVFAVFVCKGAMDVQRAITAMFLLQYLFILLCLILMLCLSLLVQESFFFFYHYYY